MPERSNGAVSKTVDPCKGVPGFESLSLRTIARSLKTEIQRGPIIYWMSRDQRVADNHALLFAQGLAIERKVPLIIVFCLAPSFEGATSRHYSFMLRGLREVEAAAGRLNIPFVMLMGEPAEMIAGFAEETGAGTVVTDFNPLRISRQWKEKAAKLLTIPLYEVDAHNIVPAWIASQKSEYSARTIRPKILKLLPQFLTEIPSPVIHPFTLKKEFSPVNREAAGRFVHLDQNASLPNIKPGAQAAIQALDSFIRGKLDHYPEDKNDPSKEALSNLSPYLHFGQISPQRVALEVQKAGGPGAAVYLEELIIRRELSDNYCLYNLHYDSFDGFPPWAGKTLKAHWDDPRNYIYTSDEFESASTHDPLWNAAQMELVKTGKMHGYMRMYWAKKILEWSSTPEEAVHIAVFLNDRYSLDGRDPNGYAGISWSIGGVHDRPWFTRPVFGNIRYMSSDGCRRKFDADKYICKISKL
jgi:deoxyribodipyrimidine photo-lyase